MNASAKATTILAAVVFSAALLFPSPAQARPRRSRARSAPARNRGGGSNHGLSLSVDLGRLFVENAPSTRSTRQWIRGHHQTRTKQVLVEPAHYEWQKQTVLVEPGHYEVRVLPTVEKIRPRLRRRTRKVVFKPTRTRKVWIPDRYEIHKVKVLVPDRYETVQIRVWVPGHWVSQPVRQPTRSWLNLGTVFNFRF